MSTFSRARLVQRLQKSEDGPLVMGILNRTPDSFSDGGHYFTTDASEDLQPALAHAFEMIEAGARLIDVGGESTRPGARAVEEAEELARVLPLVRELVAQDKCWVSVDTQRASIAEACLDAGAHLINDVSAGERDARMFPLVAEYGVPYCAMHMQGVPETMQQNPRYQDVLGELRSYLLKRASLLEAAGLPAACILLDPGIGFGKTLEHNLELMAQLDSLVRTGYPVLLGASRKSFLQHLYGSPVEQRLGGSIAAALFAAQLGARVIRVHDVRETVQALSLYQRLYELRMNLTQAGNGSL